MYGDGSRAGLGFLPVFGKRYPCHRYMKIDEFVEQQLRLYRIENGFELTVDAFKAMKEYRDFLEMELENSSAASPLPRDHISTDAHHDE